MPHIRNCAQGRIVVDDQFMPLLISEFHGKAEVEDAKWHFELQNRLILDAARRGLRTISVTDATHSAKPDADARKFWADSMSQSPRAVQDATLGTFVVVNSAVIRGALTAIGWLNPKAREISSFATLPQALREAMRQLSAARMSPPPLDPDSYQFPIEDSCGAV